VRVTGFDGGVNFQPKPKEVTLMINSNERIIKHKIGLLNLAEELGNVSQACKMMGLSRGIFTATKMLLKKASYRPCSTNLGESPAQRIGWMSWQRKRFSAMPF
jgi:hypothetical protein